MTISSSLSAGVAGLRSNATKLATISDNISNSSTYGYKRIEADFQSVVISGTGAGGYNAGGVRTSTSRMIDQAGALISTNNATDIAVRGRGMIPVARSAEVAVGNGSAQMLLTTTGSFRPDDKGFLVTQSGLTLMGWEANQDGTMPAYPRDTSSGLQPVQLRMNELEGDPTTLVNLGINLPADQTKDLAEGRTQNLQVEYYDNLGTSEELDLEFIPSIPAPGGDATNTWTMIVRDSALGNSIIGEYVLEFNDDRTGGGSLKSVTIPAGAPGGTYDPETGEVLVDVFSGPMRLNLGMLNENGGMSQLSDPFAPLQIFKNGQPVGNMTRVEIDANGFMNAFYDNGKSRVIWQIPLVDMPNPNGLLSLDSQTYSGSPNSGPIFLWDAGDGPTGDMVGFAREESNTDVATELTSLIQTQRAYSSNAKVIQTVDEMLQETTNIKR